VDSEELIERRQEICRLHDAHRFRAARTLARELASLVPAPTLKAGVQEAQSLSELAQTLGMVGEGRWARVHLERSLKLMERAVGPNHPEVARLLLIQAHLLEEFVYYPELEGLFSRALAIREEAYPAGHPEIGEALLAWADLITRHWHLYLARPKARRALGILSGAHGPHHPLVLRCREILALASNTPADQAHTVGLLKEIMEVRVRVQGEDHPDILKSLQTLLEMTPDAAEARDLYHRALTLSAKVAGTEDPLTALTHVLYAERALKSQDTTAALPLLETALSILEVVFSADHPDRMGVFGRLTMLLVFAERSAEVMALQRRMSLLKNQEER
jgi:tetratricopeptide (TPR) repeat protein